MLKEGSNYDFVIVGAGFAGSVVARKLADAGKRVALIDQRQHVGGNAFDEHDDHGVLVHRYGPHIFHTNSTQVVAFLSRFTTWRPYEHRVQSRLNNSLYPMPINRTTLEHFFACRLETDDAAQDLLDHIKETPATIRNSEDVVVSQVGRKLYEAFFQAYTRKQWRRDPSQLDRSVCARIPVRTNRDDRYFTDSFQAMPQHGYHTLFTNMLDHGNIDVATGTAYDAAVHRSLAQQLIWTGPIDAFFDHCYGSLPYRSLRFEHQHLRDTEQFQTVGTVNEAAAAIPYTRTTEFKHLTGQSHAGTSIVREFPLHEDGGDPYYPIADTASKALYKQYQALAHTTPNVHFVGRLAQYRYYNMDQVVAAALTAADKLLTNPA